ncbi:MAG: VWA domain-containing protein [Vicinamibacterales bacterium]
MRSAWIGMIVALAGTPALAQPRATPSPVTIDVVVDGSGPRVAPLQARDFEVIEDGHPLTIRDVRVVQPASETAPLPPVLTEQDERADGNEASHVLAVYIDDYHLRDDAGTSAATREIAAFVRTSLGPRDMVVVLKPLDSIVAIRATADREAVARVIESTSGREGDYEARTPFERNFVAGSRDRIDATRSQIVLSGLSALTAHLSRFPGRKSLLIVSNGVVPPATPVRSEQPRNSPDVLVRTANRAGVAVYVVRPSHDVNTGAADTARDGATRDALAAVATETTGFTIDGLAAIAPGLARLLSDARRHYLLSVEPPADAVDGRFRTVNVRVNRPGISVRARGGYAVPINLESRIPTVRPLPAGLRVPRHVSPLIRAWFGQTAVGMDQTRVDFVWEPVPRRAGDRGVQAVPARVVMTVTTMDGDQVFTGEALPAGRDAIVPSAIGPKLTFTSTPGPLLVRMDILDVSGRVLDQDVRDLSVAAAAPGIGFGTASVYRARTMRDIRTLNESPESVAPVASRQFSRAEQIVVRVPVIAGAAQPTVTARLNSGFGQTLRALTTADAPGVADVVQVDLPLASLASGRYIVEFTARSGASAAVERVEFVVTP